MSYSTTDRDMNVEIIFRDGTKFKFDRVICFDERKWVEELINDYEKNYLKNDKDNENKWNDVEMMPAL